MSIDEAIAQLEFNDKKGAKIMKEVCGRLASDASVINTSQTPDLCTYSECVFACSQVLLEAQEIAVKNHNVEYKSNLYVGGYAAFVKFQCG